MNTNSSGIYCKFTNSKRKDVEYNHMAAKPKKQKQGLRKTGIQVVSATIALW
jgi:hypothetical protein